MLLFFVYAYFENGRFYHERVYFETVLTAKFILELEEWGKNKIPKGFKKIKNQKPWLGKKRRIIC